MITYSLLKALEDIVKLAPETEQNKNCNCTVCEMRRIAEAALKETLTNQRVWA